MMVTTYFDIFTLFINVPLISKGDETENLT